MVFIVHEWYKLYSHSNTAQRQTKSDELFIYADLVLNTTIGNLPSATFQIADDLEGEWILSAKDDDIKGLSNDLRKSETVNDIAHDRIKPEVIEDIILMFNYKII